MNSRETVETRTNFKTRKKEKQTIEDAADYMYEIMPTSDDLCHDCNCLLNRRQITNLQRRFN